MPRGLTIAAHNVDLAAFEAFVIGRGAVCETASGADVVRIKAGHAIGHVSRRRDGRLTFSGVARPLFERMQEAARAARSSP